MAGFTYTQPDKRLVVHLPTVITTGPFGRIEGLLPLIQRLTVLHLDPFSEFVRSYGTPLIDAAFLVAVNRLPENDQRPVPLLSVAAFGNKRAAGGRRWEAQQPNDDDILTVFLALNQPERDENPASMIYKLTKWCLSNVEQLLEREPGSASTDYLTNLGLGWRVDSQERVTVESSRSWWQDPFEICRLEALVALASGGAGVVECDVCDRWFVPLRGGRPARRCPGFECGQIAEQMYQQSNERREYRRLQMRVARAERRGDITAAQEAREQLALLSKRNSRGGQDE